MYGSFCFLDIRFYMKKQWRLAFVCLINFFSARKLMIDRDGKIYSTKFRFVHCQHARFSWEKSKWTFGLSRKRWVPCNRIPMCLCLRPTSRRKFHWFFFYFFLQSSLFHVVTVASSSTSLGRLNFQWKTNFSSRGFLARGAFFKFETFRSSQSFFFTPLCIYFALSSFYLFFCVYFSTEFLESRKSFISIFLGRSRKKEMENYFSKLKYNGFSFSFFFFFLL